MRLRHALAVALIPLPFLSGCGGHDAQWNAGYKYASNNLGSAEQNTAPGVFGASDWCAVSQKYDLLGPTGGDWTDGCVQALHDASIP